MLPKSFLLKEEADLKLLASSLLAELTVPFVILLDGDLGAGKTTFMKYFVASLASDDKVNSPTFGKIHQYSFSGGTIYHLDLYRELPSPMELEEILLDEQAVVCIEWAKRLQENETLNELINAVNCQVAKLNFSITTNEERLVKVEVE